MATTSPDSLPVTGLTRRRLLATGGAAGAAAMLGFQPWSPDAAAAATPASDVPLYLRRSAYLAPSTLDYTAGLGGVVTTFTLTGIRDLPGDPKLVGAEDAFALEFASSSATPAGIHAFSHPDLGSFDLFVAPVEAGGSVYEVVVNRSVGAPRHPPTLATGGAKPAPGTEPPTGTQKHPHKHKRHVPRVRHVSARRLAHSVVCEIGLTSAAHVKKATVWLAHHDRVVAATTVHHVHGQRIALRMPFRHRPPGGHYVVTVSTTDRHGKVELERLRVTLG